MVELRTRTHLHSPFHSIRAIKDGSIKTVVNKDARGKSKLKLRLLVDIYNQGNTKDGDESVPRVVRDLDNVSTRGSCMFGGESNIETVPDGFDMTLEKIRKQCREKKRKLGNRGDTKTTASQVKGEECDLEEPLSNWNTKFSKRSKKKQARVTKCGGSTSSPSAIKVDVPVFCDVKPEAMDCNKEGESTTSGESVEEIMHEFKETRLVLYRRPEPISFGMVAVGEPLTPTPVDEVFEDASEEFDDGGCLADNIDLENQANVLYSSVSREEIEMEVPQSSESETIGSVENLIYSNPSSESEEANEDEQSNGSKPKLDMIITGLEIVKIEAPEILAMPITGLEIVKIEAPEVLTTGSSDFVVENVKIVLETESIVKDELPEAIDDIIQLTNCCNSLANLHLVPVDSTIPLEEDQQPQLCKEPEEVTTGTETKSIEQQQLHYQPEKLLSGRKALSPTSQAKLRKAMEQPDSPEKRSKKSKGKLYFSNQNSHRILKAQGLDSIDLVEVVPDSKRSNQKANNHTQQRQYQRATHKFSRRAGKRQPFSTGCTSIQGCTQKAIAFSQGQVRDFQFVATRLTKELKSMREITKRCLLAETNTSNVPESNLDEVKSLVKNAEKVEKSSEKWLSIIERDCNRFCKLMGLVKEDTPVPENIVQKEKKIKFADDAGGDLCHVKVFEIDLEPEL